MGGVIVVKNSRRSFRFGGDSFSGTVYCTNCRCQTERTGTVHRHFYDASPTAAVEIDADVHTFMCPLCGRVVYPPAFLAFGRDGYTTRAISSTLNVADKYSREETCKMMAKHWYCPGITPQLIERWLIGDAQELAGEEDQSVSYLTFTE